MWTTQVESILEKICANCITLAFKHRKNYRRYTHSKSYFAIPSIIINNIAAVLGPSLISFVDQVYITAVITILNVISSIIQSISLYLGIDSRINSSEKVSADFDNLALDICVMLELNREMRPMNAMEYLKDVESQYCAILKEATVLRSEFANALYKSIVKDVEIELISTNDRGISNLDLSLESSDA